MDNQTPRRALVLEDDEDIRGLLVQILTMEGFEVLEAGTAKQGMEAVRQGVDLITLDLNLPDGDGIDVCREIRLVSDAYVLMITARTEEIQRLTGLETGADDYLSKPFSPRELVARINSLFRRQKSQTDSDAASRDELDRASMVQKSLLPGQTLGLPGYEMAGRFQPSRAVGGDFYDWYAAPHGLHLTVADAMGKGMGAALIAATVRAVMRSASAEPNLDTAFAAASRALESDLEQSGSFVTAFHARLHADDGTLKYIDAGHGLALHIKANGNNVRLPSCGPPIGAWPGQSWATANVSLEPGDTLAVVSDGLLDIFDDVDEFSEAVATVIEDSASTRAACDAVASMTNGAAVSDDVTVVLISRNRREPLSA
ncbi:SpoIIE family protein phosphatase [Arthrobacter sp. H5]|uniref:PP2C family protein-serine/threonine phosphatase n=1 Tax=Arthrobacter sp. H5 TaxID=1267973 RepID=UPI0004850464|nr:SpoIIE family protein phosphatase [Arthrobacter sp. H5]